jgi:arylformamidase
MLLDISMPVSPRSAHFPGDTPFSCSWTLRFERGESVNLTAVTSSPHVGTHVDAPLHYDPRSTVGVSDLPLEAFEGPCRVVRVVGAKLVEPRHVAGLDLDREERILFRTRDQVDPNRWDPDFTALAPETADVLAAAGVRLVGLDTPSFDPADSKDLAAHRALGRGGVVNLENLDLSRVPEGRYRLSAFPIRYERLDAAPVRAVLRTI